MPSHDIDAVRTQLLERVGNSETPRDILRAPEFKDLYAAISKLPAEERGSYGKAVNELKQAV
jgi:hypothetical protein